MNHEQDAATSGGRQVLRELIETSVGSCHISVKGLQRRLLHKCDCYQSSEDEAGNALDARNTSDPVHEPQDERSCPLRTPRPSHTPCRIILPSHG